MRVVGCLGVGEARRGVKVLRRLQGLQDQPLCLQDHKTNTLCILISLKLKGDCRCSVDSGDQPLDIFSLCITGRANTAAFREYWQSRHGKIVKKLENKILSLFFVLIPRYPYLGIGHWQNWAGWSFYKYFFHEPRRTINGIFLAALQIWVT